MARFALLVWMAGLLWIAAAEAAPGEGEEADVSRNVTDFFARAKTAPVARIRDELLHEGLRSSELDANMVARMAKELATRWGDFKGFQGTVERQETAKGKPAIFKLPGKFEFEKGAAEMRLEFLGGQLAGFSLANALNNELADVWEVVPEDTAPYGKKGEAFLRALLERKFAAGWELLHEDTQKAIGSVEKFASSMADKSPGKGVESIELVEAKRRADPKAILDLHYRCKVAGKLTKGRVSIAFWNMHSLVSGFSYPAD